uniref:Uncharacterized protein n=1 Tax=Phakopsora pachyrhizi TaxID=170000 RepID=A0A0S1MIU5_PHAPC
MHDTMGVNVILLLLCVTVSRLTVTVYLCNASTNFPLIDEEIMTPDSRFVDS